MKLFVGVVPLGLPVPKPPGMEVEDDPKVGVEEIDPKVDPNADMPSDLFGGAGDAKVEVPMLVPVPAPGPNKPAPRLTFGAARPGDPKVGAV